MDSSLWFLPVFCHCWHTANSVLTRPLAHTHTHTSNSSCSNLPILQQNNQVIHFPCYPTTTSSSKQPVSSAYTPHRSDITHPTTQPYSLPRRFPRLCGTNSQWSLIGRTWLQNRFFWHKALIYVHTSGKRIKTFLQLSCTWMGFILLQVDCGSPIIMQYSVP